MDLLSARTPNSATQHNIKTAAAKPAAGTGPSRCVITSTRFDLYERAPCTYANVFVTSCKCKCVRVFSY